MARKKTIIQYIVDDNSRRTTLKKRRRGLIKKVGELATLCDVRACAVVYGEDLVEPEVWPNEHEARETLLEFKEIPESEQSKKMMDQERFLKQCVSKHDYQLRRVNSEIHELEMTLLMVDGLTGGSFGDVSDVSKATTFTNFLAGKAKAVHERIEATKVAAAEAEAAQMAIAPALEEATTTELWSLQQQQQQQALMPPGPTNCSWFPGETSSSSSVANNNDTMMFGSDLWDAAGSMDQWNIDPTLLHM